MKRSCVVLFTSFFIYVGGSQAQSPSNKPQPLAVALEGGISMGAYEAGVAWVLMSFLKLRYELELGELHMKKRGYTNKDCLNFFRKKRASTDRKFINYCRLWKRMSGMKKSNENGYTLQRRFEKSRRSFLGLIKDPFKIVSVSGGSAGNINTFLSTMTWFDESIGSVQNNYFWNAWMTVGLNTLQGNTSHCGTYKRALLSNYKLIQPNPTHGNEPAFIRKYNCPNTIRDMYTINDGLFTRRAFMLPIHFLKERFEKKNPSRLWSPYANKLLKDTFWISIPLAGAQARDSQLGNVTYATQNYHVAFRPFLQGKRMGFLQTPKTPIKKQTLGFISQRVILRERKRYGIAFSTTQNVFKAGSAFPMAFGSVGIPVCQGTLKACMAKQRFGCKPEQKNSTCTKFFVDGGTFDNLPIGLAYNYIEKPTDQQKAKILSITTTRETYQQYSAVHLKPPPDASEFRGLSFLLKYLSGIASTAMTGEKRNFFLELLRKQRNVKKRIRSRAARLTRERLRQLRMLHQQQIQKFQSGIDTIQKHIDEFSSMGILSKEQKQQSNALNQKMQFLQEQRQQLKEFFRLQRQLLRKGFPQPPLASNQRQKFIPRQPIISHGIYGSHLVSFAAFIGPHYRKYDFYLGMFDAMRMILRHEFQKKPRARGTFWSSQTIEDIRFLYRLFELDRPSHQEAWFVIHAAFEEALRKEFQHSVFETLFANRERKPSVVHKELRTAYPLVQRLITLKRVKRWIQFASLSVSSRTRKMDHIFPHLLSVGKLSAKKQAAQRAKKDAKIFKFVKRIYDRTLYDRAKKTTFSALYRKTFNTSQMRLTELPLPKTPSKELKVITNAILMQGYDVMQKLLDIFEMDMFNTSGNKKSQAEERCESFYAELNMQPNRKKRLVAECVIDLKREWMLSKRYVINKHKGYTSDVAYKQILQADGIYGIQQRIKAHIKELPLLTKNEKDFAENSVNWFRKIVKSLLNRLWEIELDNKNSVGVGVASALGFIGNSEQFDTAYKSYGPSGSIIPHYRKWGWGLWPVHYVGLTAYVHPTNANHLDWELWNVGWSGSSHWFELTFLKLLFGDRFLLLTPVKLTYSRGFVANVLKFGVHAYVGFMYHSNNEGEDLWSLNPNIGVHLTIASFVKVEFNVGTKLFRFEDTATVKDDLFTNTHPMLLNISIGLAQPQGWLWWVLASGKG
ncbi:MAG: hypothetical protein CL920_18145 [Deltaproteobacteria bacterium]|nr:hypothetical protein [Deltaproteobacteria bacterium]